MPKFPSLSGPAQAMPSSVFASLMRRLEQYPGEVVPFHIGDTFLPPPEAGRLGAQSFSNDPQPEYYKYSPPPGKSDFIDSILEKVHRLNHMTWTEVENIQITAGATHGLSCSVRAVLNPGDQILLLSPYWPLIRGIAVSAGVRPVEVPFSQVLLSQEDVDIEGMLENFITPETAAIYMSTPNNPDGLVLTERELSVVAKVAQRHNLWVLSDEVYEKFTFDGREHVSIANLPGMCERTLTVYSFSKSYAQAGLRVGYVVGPAEPIVAVRKMSNHTIYCVPRAMQQAAHAAMANGETFLKHALSTYHEHRDIAFEKVAAPCAKPQGCTYLFLDLRQYCRRGEDSSLGVLERLADAGLLLAPGGAFGHLFNKWARLCFTSVPKEQLVEGIERLNAVLERG